MNILQQLHVKNNVPHSLLKHKNLKSTILFRYAHEVLDIINGRRGSFSCLPTANSLLFPLSTQHSALSFPSLSTSLPPGLSMPPQPLYRLSKFAVHRVRDSDCSSIPLCINYPSIIYYKINCLNKNKLIASTTIIPTHPSITHQLKIRPRKEHTSSTSGLHLHRTVLLSQYQQLLECSETPRPYSFLLLQTVPVKTH